MDKHDKNNSNELTIESVRISYLGVIAKDDAQFLYEKLHKQQGFKIPSPIEIPSRIAELGVPEVLVTIILTSMAKDIWNIILNLLKNYTQEKKLYGQVIIKQDENDLGRRFPYHKETNWGVFFKAIDKYINERERESLTDMITKRVEIDDDIKRLFEREATFLDIDVVCSKKLREEEPDLIISAYSFEQYHKYVKEKAEENKGKVLNAVGDEVMAWFKSPRDAINCALAIFKERDEFNKRNRLKNQFQFRIGINTGLALVDDKEGKGFSKGVLDLAGHLQKEAEHGRFIISENTYNRLEDKDKVDFHKYKYIERDKAGSYIFNAET